MFIYKHIVEKAMSQIKAAVTGGCGFLGSHVVDELLSHGVRVYCIDNLSNGKIENIKSHLNDPSFKFVQCDIRDTQNLLDVFEGVDWVMHLAALTDIVPSVENPLEYHSVNVDGTVSVLEACRKSGVKRLIYAASSSCYGIPEIYPTPETAKISPQYPYALTKWIGEQYLFHWHKVYGISCVSLRIFNAYGPRVRCSSSYGAVFAVFLSQKAHGVPYTVVGDGKQKRDFVHARDVARAFYLAAESEIDGEAINIGSGNPQTINYLVKLLGGEKVHIPKRPGEPEITYADISKAKKILGWSPVIDFEDGVKEMLLRLDEWKNAPLWTPESIAKATEKWFRYLSKK
jgi:UDP-glucose 4-epimerase